jgi:copper chaperone CopZ
MTRFFLTLALSATLGSTAALACGGEKCDSAHCKMPATATAAVALPAGDKADLKITGMKCGSCEGKVVAALTGIKGVKGVTASAANGTASVSYDKALTNTDALVAAVTALSYTVEVVPAAVN